MVDVAMALGALLALSPLLLVLAISYVGVGIAIRIGGSIRRRLRPHAEQPPQEPEHQVG